MKFSDRTDAGEQLAARIVSRMPRIVSRIPPFVSRPADQEPGSWPLDRLIVLALPRGGVPVARPVADRLGCPLRLLLVRKLGVPGHPELAMGAIAAIGSEIRTVRNEQVIEQCGVRPSDWDRVWEDESAELRRRTDRFGDRTAPRLDGAPVILIDDGLATGATMRAAVASVQDSGSNTILVAVPVGSPQAVQELQRDGIDVIALSLPDPLIAVGEAYRDFHQLSDDEVLGFLAER